MLIFKLVGQKRRCYGAQRINFRDGSLHPRKHLNRHEYQKVLIAEGHLLGCETTSVFDNWCWPWKRGWDQCGTRLNPSLRLHVGLKYRRLWFSEPCGWLCRDHEVGKFESHNLQGWFRWSSQRWLFGWYFIRQEETVNSILRGLL